MTDLKASPCGEMSDQGQGPSQKLLRDLLERRGLIEDSSIRNEKARVAEKELRRNMYHNTQVMLKNYRDIVWALECFPGETAQELEQPLKDVDALLSAVDAQIAMGNAKDAVKERADLICKSVEEDGIYEYCLENQLI